MTSAPRTLRLAVALEGAGWHPAAWREPDARPASLFTARYWRDLVQEAERASLDFVTFADGFSLQDGGRGVVRGRLEAVLLAAAVAPRTRGIGLVPEVIATHTEPFHVSKAIASLDYASRGRAGQLVRISSDSKEFAHIGRREPVSTDDLLDEAADYIEVVRRLWDSWEDDAEIRDAATGRFIDRDKLHYIDFDGPFFSVKGPSITPRPPQGNPPVLARARTAAEIGFATGKADVTIVPAAEQPAVPEAFGELVVFLAPTAAEARHRLERLDEWHAAPPADVPVFVGTPRELSEKLIALHDAGYAGFELHPGTLPHDLVAITRDLVPLLQGGTARRGYPEDTLRARLGLKPAVNRYVEAS